MKTSRAIFSILLGFVAFEPISANSQNEYNSTTCKEQEPCLKFTGYNLLDLEDASFCEDKACGQYTVCVELDFDSKECPKPRADKFAYTCAHGYSKEYGPKRYPEVCNPAAGGLTSKKPGAAWVKNNAEFCQTVSPGESAVFIFKDGDGICLDSGDYASSGTSGITCKKSEEEHCNANRIGKECVWTVPTPKCLGAETKPPTSSPTSTPTSAPTETPTASPTSSPVSTPTSTPTSAPTETPTASPTSSPVSTPTSTPTSAPTETPTASPTSSPVSTPTSTPTSAPTETPTASPTSSPVSTPTSTPTSAPTETPTASPTTQTSAPASVGGDPHFKTWAGEHYDFHGVCDLILLKNHDFKSGLGMDIHIRTKKIRQWSYISNAVVRIGEDLFELRGDPSVKNGFKYWANTLAGAGIPVHDNYMVLPTTLSGYPIRYRRVNLKQHEFIIDLDNHEEIVLKTWKELVRVDINGATSANFGNSSGLMGAFEDGARLSRDKKSTFGNDDEFGLEWQVRATEPMLFHEIDGPQAPEKCVLPSTSSLRKRLEQSLISQKEAETACSGVQSSSSDFTLCVFDVMATNDVGVAGAYSGLLK